MKGLAGAGGLALTGSLSAPALSQGAAARTLRFVPQANLANFDPIWGTQYVVRNAGRAGLGHALRHRLLASAAAADGRVRAGERRRHDLDVQAAPGPQVPRRRAGAEQGRRREPDALGRARSDGLDDQGAPAGADRRRRPHLQMGAEAALPEAALRARQEQLAVLLHHAGAHRADRPVQADRRVCRLRADEVRQGRMGARRESGVREVRRLRAAAGKVLVACRRQADAGRPRRMGGDAGSGHRGGCLAERRGRLVGEPDRRPRSGPEEEQEHQRRYRRSPRQYRLVPHELPVSRPSTTCGRGARC